MLKNYLKITWKVFIRNKLFTAISLFGICLTLTILLVGTAFYDYFAKPHYPASKQSNIAYLTSIFVWDEKLGENSYNNAYRGNSSYFLLNNYVRSLKTQELVSIYSSIYKKVYGNINEKTVEFLIKYTDNEFWQILDFNFMNGRAFNKLEVANGDKVAVISESIANSYFTQEKVIGSIIEADKVSYKVIGVVEDSPLSSLETYGNIWVPVTSYKADLSERKLGGDFSAMMLLKKKSDLNRLDRELQSSLARIDFPLDGFNYIEAHTTSFLEQLILLSPLSKPLFYIFLIVVIIILICIPSLNLTNMNSTRIQERLSEIGIRKSFGATRISLTIQFVLENIIHTLFGGFLAFIFSILILKGIQTTGIIPANNFPINFRIFFIGTGLCMAFGLISGVIPAFRMSRLRIIESINEGE